MFNKLFTQKKESIHAPLTGKAVALEQVPDPVFSEKMMGDGMAIEPTENQVFSPVEGEVVSVFPTKHAITIRSKSGAEILIHMGLETVKLNGEGFQVHVAEGDKVKKGNPIAEFDIQQVSNTGTKIITPIILLNGEQFKIENKQNNQSVTGGQDVMMEITKIK